jgi:prephenate dehydrogenase
VSDNPRFLPIVQPPRDAAAPPVFGRIAIVGLGLIGGSIALAARERWPSSLVIGVDDKDVLERAMRRHAVDVGADDPIVAAEADLVILAAPVAQNIELLGALAEHVRGSAVVTDVGSTKRSTLAAAAVLPARLTFVGGHPLGGAARQGIDHARSDLFRGRPWLFTPTGATPPETLDRLFLFASALGAEPRAIDPVEHDRIAARISHLPQLAASALMRVIGDEVGEEGLALSGRGLADTTRLASSPAGIWGDICATNEDEIGAALDALIDELQRVRGRLTERQAVEELFDAANEWKARLARIRGDQG